MNKTVSKKQGRPALNHGSPLSPEPTPLVTVGHEVQRAFFRNLIEKQRLPSTMLLAGPGGVGKRRVAKEIAQTLFCENSLWAGCKDCHSCSLFDHHNLPDLYQLDFADDQQNSIDSVRGLLYSLQLKSFGGSNRVVIFDNAHLMSVAATNLLLKTLEEPRPDTYFMLISSSKARMLPTLLSRSQVIHFSHLKSTEVEEILSSTPGMIADSISAAERTLLIEMTDGTLEGIPALSSELPFAQSISERVDQILTGSSVDVPRLAAELAKDKERLSQIFRILTVLIRSKLHHSDDLKRRNVLAYALQNCVASERLALERNLSTHYLLTMLFSQLAPLPLAQEPLLIENVVV